MKTSSDASVQDDRVKGRRGYFTFHQQSSVGVKRSAVQTACSSFQSTVSYQQDKLGASCDSDYANSQGDSALSAESGREDPSQGEKGGVTSDSGSASDSAAQSQLAQSQSLIEQLQQNLSTKLKSSTVETFRNSYSPTLEKAKVGLPPAIPPKPLLQDNEPGIATSKKNDPKLEFWNRTVATTTDKTQIWNVVVSPPKVEEKTTGEENVVVPPSEANKSNRVSWTTTLLEKLSEEKTKKTKEAPKQTPHRLVRYPGQKDFDDSKHKHPLSVISPKTSSPAIRSGKELPEERISKREVPKNIENSSVDTSKKDLNDSGKDAYADLITHLVVGSSGEAEGEPQVDAHSSAPWLQQSNRTSESPSDVPDACSVVPENTPVRNTVAIQLVKSFPERDIVVAVPKKSTVGRNEHSTVPDSTHHNRNTVPTLPVKSFSNRKSIASVLEKNSPNRNGIVTETENTPYNRKTPDPQKSSPDRISIASLIVNSLPKENKVYSIPDKSRRLGPEVPQKATRRVVETPQVQKTKRSPRGDGTTATTASSERRATGFRRLLSPSLFSSGQRRSLSEDRSKNSTLSVARPGKATSEDELKPLLRQQRPGDSRVFPIQTKPIVETAFLSDSPTKKVANNKHGGRKQRESDYPQSVQDSPTKQNQYNLSRSHPRSKSVSPSRSRPSVIVQTTGNARTIPDTSLVLEKRLDEIRRELSPVTVIPTSRSPSIQTQNASRRGTSTPERSPSGLIEDINRRGTSTPDRSPSAQDYNRRGTSTFDRSPPGLVEGYTRRGTSTPDRSPSSLIEDFNRRGTSTPDRSPSAQDYNRRGTSTFDRSPPALGEGYTRRATNPPDRSSSEEFNRRGTSTSDRSPSAPDFNSRGTFDRSPPGLGEGYTRRGTSTPDRSPSGLIEDLNRRGTSTPDRSPSAQDYNRRGTSTFDRPPSGPVESLNRQGTPGRSSPALPEEFIRRGANTPDRSPSIEHFNRRRDVRYQSLPIAPKARLPLTAHAQQIYQNVDPRILREAYYHSQQNARNPSVQTELDGTYSSSSTSTIVSQPGWNPISQAISGSPDIRRLQQNQSPPAQRYSPLLVPVSAHVKITTRTAKEEEIYQEIKRSQQGYYSPEANRQSKGGNDPLYSNQKIQNVSVRGIPPQSPTHPKAPRMSRGELEALYVQTQLLREQKKLPALDPRMPGHYVSAASLQSQGSTEPAVYGNVNTLYVRGVAQDGLVQLRRPIFKRGSLVSASDCPSPGPDGGAPKRVSFTGATEPSTLWPTRNGPAPEPPTRHRPSQRSSGDSDVFLEAPTRPLPPIPRDAGGPMLYGVVARRQQQYVPSESESGSEAGEVQRILNVRGRQEEEWGADGKARGPPGSEHSASSGGRDEEVRRGGGGGGRPGRRDEPRRHTLSGDHHQHHQHQSGSLARSMDLEMSSKSQRRKSPLPRGYPPPSTAMLFDDDPGIMSEVETSSTGFRRGGKQRSSLPVVRTPSKTLERPLGLVFLQYRSETKRALLPNEITSIDTVKALFVRSFPKQLTMEYLDSPLVKIYIHDSSKDMFYELEDLRSHLRDIRDRSVLRLFESADMNGGVLPGAGVGVVAPAMWDQDQSYFSEPEFDSEYQHQHIHKTKTSSKSSSSGGVAPQPYYMTHSYPPGGSQGGPGAPATLPRGGPLLRAYSPAVVPPVPAERMKTLPQTGIQPPPKPVRTYRQAHLMVKGPLNMGPQVPDRIYGSFISPSDRRDAHLYSSPDRLHSESGYMSSPERGGPRSYPSPYPAGGPGYEDPYYSQYASRSGSITPVIDEEASDTELMDESYSLYGVKLPTGRPVAPQPRSQFPAPAVVPYDATRIRVEHMERQLANLTGLVQKALTQTPTPREYLQVPSARDANYRNAADEYDKHSSSSSASLPDDSYLRTDTKPPKLGKDKSVSFEKSVSFSDEPPDMNSPKQHSPQHTADSKPTKPAIKSSTLPRMSSQERTERDRHKPAPPPKPVSLSPGQYEGRHVYRDLQLTPEMYNQLRGLQKKAKDLRQEVRNLRRMSQAQAHSVRETIRDTFIKIRAMLLMGGEEAWANAGDADKMRLSREEDSYKQEMIRLEKDLTELESTVEELRGNVINRKTRVNMSDVENMALILSKSSKTVADLKVRFPSLQEGMKSLLSSEMEKVVREEKFLKEEPERLESALRRCKKLTGTLVTLKRLASVQEQRLPPSSTPDARLSPTLGGDSDTPITPPAHGKPGTIPARGVMASPIGSGSDSTLSRQRPENALDALLDELQTFARPPSNSGHNPTMSEIGRKGSIDSAHPPTVAQSNIPGTTSSLRRLHSYPSSSDGGGNSPPTVPLSRLQVSGPVDPPKSPATSPKPPVPERNSELLSHLASGRRVPPPPPPRTSSRSPLASPTSPSLPPRGQHPPNQPQMGVGSGTLLRRGGPGRSSLREPLRGSPGISLVAEPKPPVEETGNIPGTFNPLSASNSSSCESVNSQEGLQNKSGNKARQEILEQRHQELLRKQRALQEQYARLQQLQRGGGGGLTVVPPPDLLLKKTGSESNLLAKMGLGHGLTAAAPISGSLTHLAAVAAANQPLTSTGGLLQQKPINLSGNTITTSSATNATTTTTTTNKIYETDIL